MFSMRKIIALTALGAAVLVSAWLICSRVAQARRDSAWRAAIVQFQRDLPIGTSKADVQRYLNARNIRYLAATRGGSRVEAYEIKIGEDPGGLVCEPWDVSVALEFSSADVLKQIHISRSGTCL
jgi:hypothetical protein